LINNTDVDHVVHIHDVDWRVVRRTMPTDAQIDEDTALKETLNVRAHEVVVLMSRFTDNVGSYMLHCHILEHEDRAMMARFDVRPAA
ncbi:MAG: multicopper oxidase domain-containing protein, partial [Frankia sp.]|nr:multicopper oxidase domain-containing protein [Frankia sp.]